MRVRLFTTEDDDYREKFHPFHHDYVLCLFFSSIHGHRPPRKLFQEKRCGKESRQREKGEKEERIEN